MSRFFLAGTAFFDACFLAGEFAQVVEFCATNFTVFVDSYAVDKRRLQGEDTLNTDVIGHFANCKTLFVAVARDADDNTLVHLDTLFVALFNAIGYCDCVASVELGMLFAGGKSLLGDFDQIHFKFYNQNVNTTRNIHGLLAPPAVTAVSWAQR